VNFVPSVETSHAAAGSVSVPSTRPVTRDADRNVTGASKTSVRWSPAFGLPTDAKPVFGSPSNANWRMFPPAVGSDDSMAARTT